MMILNTYDRTRQPNSKPGHKSYRKQSGQKSSIGNTAAAGEKSGGSLFVQPEYPWTANPKTALATIARMLTGDKANAFTCNWANVGYQHSAAIRSQLAGRYSIATTNKMLCALRRVLQETWRLGFISAEAYQRSADVGNVQGETLPTGRVLNMGE